MRYVDGSVVEATNGEGEVPETLPDPRTGEPAFRVFWRSTDAWRGHYDTEPLDGSGWIRLEEGNVCGEWDDVPPGTRTSEVEARLDALAETRDILIVILPTSNVFSMAYDCYGLAEQGPPE